MKNLLGDGVFLLGGVALGMALLGMFWFLYNFADIVTVCLGLGFIIGIGALYRFIRNRY